MDARAVVPQWKRQSDESTEINHASCTWSLSVYATMLLNGYRGNGREIKHVIILYGRMSSRRRMLKKRCLPKIPLHVYKWVSHIVMKLVNWLFIYFFRPTTRYQYIASTGRAIRPGLTRLRSTMALSNNDGMENSSYSQQWRGHTLPRETKQQPKAALQVASAMAGQREAAPIPAWRRETLHRWQY